MVGHFVVAGLRRPTSRAPVTSQDALSKETIDAAFDVATSETYDADSIDAIAERQRRELALAGLHEPPARMRPRLKCAACFIRIGPGHHETEVWWDRGKHRPICRSCANWPTMPPEQVALLISRTELEELSLGDLNRLMRARSRAIEKDAGS